MCSFLKSNSGASNEALKWTASNISVIQNIGTENYNEA
jgi:hypothetical protein